MYKLKNIGYLLFFTQQTIKAWRNVYLIAAIVALFFAFIWSILGSADIQPWNTYWDKTKQGKGITDRKNTK